MIFASPGTAVRAAFFAGALTITSAVVAPTRVTADDGAATAATAVVETQSERGPVSARVSVTPGEPRIGDPVELRLIVVAESGVELLMPEFGRSLERFRVVGFVPRESVDPQGRTVFEQRYTLELSSSGEAAIPPIIVEFVDHRDGSQLAPEGEDAYELVTERLPFRVDSVVPKPAAADLVPPLGELALHSQRGPLARVLIVGVLLCAALAVAVGVFLVRRRRGDPSKSAYEEARAELDALMARPRPGPGQVAAFFVALSTVVRRYLERRFELRAPELTTEEFLVEAGASPDLGHEHQLMLQHFLHRADMVKFARMIPGADDIELAVQAASRFLDETGAQAESDTDAA